VTLIDAAQSAGHRPLDVQEIDCDFLAFSGHKMCGPTGIGVLYGRGEVLEQCDPFQGGGEMILTVDYQQSTWKPAPHRFEAGTPDISGAIGSLRRWITLTASVVTALRSTTWRWGLMHSRNGSRSPPSIVWSHHRTRRPGQLSLEGRSRTRRGDRGGSVGGRVAGRASLQPAPDETARRGVHGRASFYFYNTTAEIDRFLEVLGEIQKFFGV
jgi:cysteine desulfurase/selenocysteine lyase